MLNGPWANYCSHWIDIKPWRYESTLTRHWLLVTCILRSSFTSGSKPPHPSSSFNLQGKIRGFSLKCMLSHLSHPIVDQSAGPCHRMILSGGSHLVLRRPSLGQEQSSQSASWGQRSGSIFPPMYLQYSCWSGSNYWPVGEPTTNFSICCINWLNISKQSCQMLPKDFSKL